MKHALKSVVLAFAGAAVAAAAHAAPPAPLGMAFGVASCEEALKTIGAPKLVRVGSELEASAPNPGALYPGAKSVGFICRDGRVAAVLMDVDKGGMGNPGGRELYNNLSAKYRRIAGGPIPTVGNGFARFVADDAVIHLVSPHLSFEVSVIFVTKRYWDEMNAEYAAAAKAQHDAKKSKL